MFKRKALEKLKNHPKVVLRDICHCEMADYLWVQIISQEA